MYNALKGLLIFAAMVALPLVLHYFTSGYGRAPAGASWIFALLILLAAVIALAFGLKMYTVSEQIEVMIGCLTLAERDFNNIINSGYDQSGRLKKVDERERWAKMGYAPRVQAFNEGYRSVAHDAFEANQADMKSRGQTMGKATMTAFLLRELYEGNVKAAKAKVEAEFRNGADSVYIAPGVDTLIGYEKFNKDTNRFEKNAGVNGTFLKAAADIGGFPKDIAIVKTDKVEEILNEKMVEKTVKTVVSGWDALRELIQQGRPPEYAVPSDEKLKAKPSRFWRITKAIVDDWLD